MKSVAAVVCLLTLSGSPVFGAEKCATPTQRTEWISNLIEVTDKLRSRIERVPPSDAKFICDELEEAVLQNNEQRANIVFRNAFYHPLQVHDAVDKVINDLSIAKEASLKQQALQVVDALGAFWNIVSSLNSYIEFDAARKGSILNEKQREAISFQYAFLSHTLTRLARCLVTELRE